MWAPAVLIECGLDPCQCDLMASDRDFASAYGSGLLAFARVVEDKVLLHHHLDPAHGEVLVIVGPDLIPEGIAEGSAEGGKALEPHFGHAVERRGIELVALQRIAI